MGRYSDVCILTVTGVVSAFLVNPIWIKEYTVCVAPSGDHRGTVGNLSEHVLPYSFDAQTQERACPFPRLAAKRVPVVEDDYLVAMEIARALERAGAEVIGPAPTVEAALDALEQTAPDGAILDINLGAKMAFSVADALLASGIPSIFATGMTPTSFPHASYA
jgi:hypothetical protein